MKSAIEIEGLEKSYGSHAVLQGLNFTVEKGEIFALLGVNGAGKTTTLECMEGLRKYDGGHITLHGKVGIQLQSASLPDHIKPMEAVRLFAKWNNVKIDYETLDALGMEEFGKKYYRELSTGQKRRLHLALSLVANPDILFLDEPTAGLDVEGRMALHELIRKLKVEGKTIVLASHDMAEVEALCDRIAILHKGNILFLGSVAELNQAIVKRYSICIKSEQGEERFEAESVGEALLAALQDYKKRGMAVLDVEIDRGTLEQHFVAMTKGVAE